MNKVNERKENESARAFAAARLYFAMGPERSLAKVAQELNKPLSLINRWSARWAWVDRARAFDEEFHQGVQR